MSEYNPSSTATKGMEWSPAVAGSVTLDAVTKVAAMSVLQTTAQVTANEKVYVGAIPTRGGLYSMEVYDNETGVPANVTSITYQPNADVSGVGALGTFAWCDQSAGTSNIFNSIDETTLDLTDYIKNTPTSGAPATSTYKCYVNSSAALTGKRILGVRVSVYGASTGGTPLYLNLGLTISGTAYTQPVTVQNSLGSAIWYYNPDAKRSWRIADITAMSSSNAVGVDTFSCCSAEARIYQMYVTVYYCDENRLAAGTLDDSASTLTPNAWNTSAVLTPTGGAWTKDGAGRHLYFLRRISSVGALVIPTVAGPTVPNPANGFSPTLDPTYGYATAMDTAIPAVWGLVQRTSAPADSVDSQPYSLQVEGKVYNGQVAKQEFSNAGVLSYGQVRALVQPNSATGNLLIKCKRVFDDVQFGSTITWTPAQVAALTDQGGGWKQLDSQMASAGVLAAATQYYLEFSDATAADDGTGVLYWSVLTLDVGDASTGVTAGFGGTTDAATINGSRATRYDIPTTIATVPTAPAGFTVTVLTQTL